MPQWRPGTIISSFVGHSLWKSIRLSVFLLAVVFYVLCVKYWLNNAASADKTRTVDSLKERRTADEVDLVLSADNVNVNAVTSLSPSAHDTASKGNGANNTPTEKNNDKDEYTRKRIPTCPEDHYANSSTSSASSCHPMYKYMYVDDKRRYIYCLVSKAACTSWKRTLLKLTGRALKDPRLKNLVFHRVHTDIISDKYLRRMIHYSVEQQRHRLKHYFKFTFVREPFERLVSVYRDKMHRDAKYMDMFIPRIVSRRQGHPTPKPHGHENVTFSEFVEFVLDDLSTSVKAQAADRHWRSQYDICCPCHIHYDFVGHYETLLADSQVVLRQISPGSNVSFPSTDPDNSHQKSSQVAVQYYRQLSSSLRASIMHAYRLDYVTFGYHPPTD